jgi:hypothetical protein
MFSIKQSVFYPGKQMPMDEFVNEYRKLYQEGIDLFAEFDPCEIHDGGCYDGRNGGSHFCCSNCDYITDAGCTVDSMWCKLWLCGTLRSKKELPKEFKDQLNILVLRSGKLCRGRGGRFGLSRYILMFYGMKGYKEFEANEPKQSVSATATAGR